MSRLEEVKDRLKALASRLSDLIQESEAYAKLQDRYQSLSAGSQRLVWIVSIFIVTFMILSYPLLQISNSQLLITTFEEKRSLIRDLFKTYRESSGQASIPVSPSRENLKNAVETILTAANLIPEQRVGLIQSTPEGKLIPASLTSHVLEVKLAKLNLKQIVDIGTSIAAISESVKMKDMLIAAHSQDTRYYDVTYKLYALNVPEPIPEAVPEIEIKPKKGSNLKKDQKNLEDSDK